MCVVYVNVCVCVVMCDINILVTNEAKTVMPFVLWTPCCGPFGVGVVDAPVFLSISLYSLNAAPVHI